MDQVCTASNSEIKFNSPTSLSFIIILTVPIRDGRLGHLCHKLKVYGKEQHPQGNHLHQRQGERGFRIADMFRMEEVNQVTPSIFICLEMLVM